VKFNVLIEFHAIVTKIFIFDQFVSVKISHSDGFNLDLATTMSDSEHSKHKTKAFMGVNVTSRCK